VKRVPNNRAVRAPIFRVSHIASTMLIIGFAHRAANRSKAMCGVFGASVTKSTPDRTRRSIHLDDPVVVIDRRQPSTACEVAFGRPYRRM
jgi:hypothetical protein